MGWMWRKVSAIFGLALTVPTVIHTAEVAQPGVAMTKRREHDQPVEGPESSHHDVVHEAALTPPPPTMPFVNNSSDVRQQDEAHEIAMRASMDQGRNNALLLLHRAGVAKQDPAPTDPRDRK